MRRHRRVIFAWAVAAAMAVGGFAAAGASAVTIPPSPGGPAYRYVALGDSFASGEGLSPYQSGSDTGADQCHRSTRSYPFLLHSEIAFGAFHDYACSGATTDKISTFAQYAPEGTAQALHRPLKHADLITVTVGGDDLGFADDLKYCAEHTYCQEDASFVAGIKARFHNLPGSLDAAYNEIRRHRRKHSTVIVLGYPRLFPTIASHQQCQIIHGHFGYGYEDSEQDYFNRKAVRLNHIIAAASRRAGFLFISPAPAFLGHAQCDPDPWMNGISVQEDGHFTFKASFHPNTKGQRQFADLIESFVADYQGARNPDGLPRDPKPTMALPVPPPSCEPHRPC
jgi:lysophospholipase L1-like esterase